MTTSSRAADGPVATPIGAVEPGALALGKPMLRWSSHARTIDGVATELARIWSQSI